jgi:hypothetical protein
MGSELLFDEKSFIDGVEEAKIELTGFDWSLAVGELKLNCGVLAHCSASFVALTATGVLFLA